MSLVDDLRDSGAFAGVHLIAGVRGPEVADRLTSMGIGSDPTTAHPPPDLDPTSCLQPCRLNPACA